MSIDNVYCAVKNKLVVLFIWYLVLSCVSVIDHVHSVVVITMLYINLFGHYCNYK